MAPLAQPRCPALPLSLSSPRLGPFACGLQTISARAASARGPGVPSAYSGPRVALRSPGPSRPAPGYTPPGYTALLRTLPRAADPLSTSRRRVGCRALDEDSADSGAGSGSGSAESLFARELRKRGLASGSRQDRTGEAEAATAAGRTATGGAASADPSSAPPPSGGGRTAGADWAEGQRERSSAMNSEGLEGLPTRALALVRLGASFYLNFWPLGLLVVVAFLTVYLAWGTDFIHAGKPASVTAPAYIDPYELLRQEEELLPMVPFRPQPDRPL